MKKAKKTLGKKAMKRTKGGSATSGAGAGKKPPLLDWSGPGDKKQ